MFNFLGNFIIHRRHPKPLIASNHSDLQCKCSILHFCTRKNKLFFGFETDKDTSISLIFKNYCLIVEKFPNTLQCTQQIIIILYVNCSSSSIKWTSSIIKPNSYTKTMHCWSDYLFPYFSSLVMALLQLNEVSFHPLIPDLQNISKTIQAY